MATTSAVRRENLAQIRRLLWRGVPLSKKDIASQLGLSVATCNTLLNEMAAAGEVVCEPRRTGNAGRGGFSYRAAEDYATIVAAYIDLPGSERVFCAKALALTGTELESMRVTLPHLDGEALLSLLEDAFHLRANTRQIVLGVPGTVRDGVIGHCDVSELDGVDLASDVAERIGVPIHIENDMHLKASGYCHEHCDSGEVTTLAYFPPHILPGTATVHAGEPIRGASGFAGMVGFLSYGTAEAPMNRKELLQLLAPATCRPLIAHAVASLCAVLNPNAIVLTGGLLDESCVEWLRDACARTIPEEFLPGLRFERDFDRYYWIGMRQTALGYLERTL